VLVIPCMVLHDFPSLEKDCHLGVSLGGGRFVGEYREVEVKVKDDDDD
jgi:hypothetical protein